MKVAEILGKINIDTHLEGCWNDGGIMEESWIKQLEVQMYEVVENFWKKMKWKVLKQFQIYFWNKMEWNPLEA